MPERSGVLVVGILAVVFVCLLPLALWWWFRCGTETTFLISRHADRVASQDALSPEGLVRAQELVHVGEKAGIVAIYHSDTERARQTAAPLAAALGITPMVYPANDVTPLVSQIFSDHRGEKVFVIGHSNTVPQIIVAAGGPSLPSLMEAEFDNLFVLSSCRCWRGHAALVSLQYGAPSP
jgi:broad specificity phosphatase PhoE